MGESRRTRGEPTQTQGPQGDLTVLWKISGVCVPFYALGGSLQVEMSPSVKLVQPFFFVVLIN